MKYSFKLRDGRVIDFSDKMEFMGIINVTPDSFFSGSRALGIDKALSRANKLVSEGALILDIGGESTRPGSDPVEISEEISRVCEVIKVIKKEHSDVLISIDTYNAKTAKAAILAGADIVNDISGLSFDKDMVKVVKEFNVPIIIMHTKGRPKDMQLNPIYDDVTKEVYEFLEKQINLALANGIDKDKIIIDLGIGFGKTYEHNIELLKNIDFFNTLQYPQLLAVSRKGFIGKTICKDNPEDRLYGTLGVSIYARSKGIKLNRVHDIKENMEAVRMYEALND